MVGTSHPDYGSALTLKAIVQLEQRHYPQALETAQRAEDILKAHFSADHWRIALANNVKGAALAGGGKYAEAEQLLLSSNEILADAPMAGVAQKSRERLERLYLAWGKEDQALRYRAPE